MRVSEFIQESSRHKSPSELFFLLERAACDRGFDQLAYGALPCHNEHRITDSPAPAGILNYPPDWQRWYFERSYQLIDPVVMYTPCIRGPYLWASLRHEISLTMQQHLLFEEASEAGLRTGFTVPLHGPQGGMAVVSFASSVGVKDVLSHIGHLYAIANQFHLIFRDLVQPKSNFRTLVRLTERERDCLAWVAQGKSSWDIGMILGISHNTVNFHIKNSMHKLGATSRVVAVLQAIRQNLL